MSLEYYTDEYVSRFFTKLYGKLPIELKIRILGDLEVENILVFQSFINDDEIKYLPIKSITKKKLNYKIDCRNRNGINYETLMGFLEYRKSIIIPVSINFLMGKHFDVSLIPKLNRFKRNIEFELSFDELTYSTCEELTKFWYSKSVTELKIPIITSDELPKELDFTNYTNLKTLQFVSINTSLTLRLSESAFQTIIDLQIDYFRDGDFINKFINLKCLFVHLQDGSILKIRDVPRSVSRLVINNSKVQYTTCSRIIINAPEDWPQNLESLLVFELTSSTSPFQDILLHTLPYSLTTLRIAGYSLSKLFSKLTDGIENLHLCCYGKDTVPCESADLIFPLNLQQILLYNLNLKSAQTTHIIPKGVRLFLVHGCDFSTSLNNINFQECSSSLRFLDIRNYFEPYEFNNLNFADFTRLSVMIFENCGIINLDNFTPPSCIQYIIIRNNDITSISETWPLLKDAKRYSHLLGLRILDCHINYVSPNIEWPKNIETLIITDNCPKKFYFNSSIINHKSLAHIELSVLSSIDFCQKETCNKESKINKLRLKGTDDLITNYESDANKFCDIIETLFKKTIQKRYHYVNGQALLCIELYWSQLNKPCSESTNNYLDLNQLISPATMIGRNN